MAFPVQTQSKYACFIDFLQPEPLSAPLKRGRVRGRGRGRGSPPRHFLTGPRVLPGPVEALMTALPGCSSLETTYMDQRLGRRGTTYHM